MSVFDQGGVEVTYPMDLPAMRAMYAVCNPEGDVMYIGKAKSLKTRWTPGYMLGWHGVFPEAFANYCTLHWMDCTGIDDADLEALERDLIAQYRPVWNSTHNRGYYQGKRKAAEWFNRAEYSRAVQVRNREAIFREHPHDAMEMRRLYDEFVI